MDTHDQAPLTVQIILKIRPRLKTAREKRKQANAVHDR